MKFQRKFFHEVQAIPHLSNQTLIHGNLPVWHCLLPTDKDIVNSVDDFPAFYIILSADGNNHIHVRESAMVSAGATFLKLLIVVRTSLFFFSLNR